MPETAEWNKIRIKQRQRSGAQSTSAGSRSTRRILQLSASTASRQSSGQPRSTVPILPSIRPQQCGVPKRSQSCKPKNPLEISQPVHIPFPPPGVRPSNIRPGRRLVGIGRSVLTHGLRNPTPLASQVERRPPVQCSQPSDDATCRVPSGRPAASQEFLYHRVVNTDPEVFCPSYEIGAPHEGICLIVNQERYNDNTFERKGSSHDAAILKDLFTDSRFHVHLENNLSGREMIRVCNDLSRRDLSEYKSLVICVLAHGKEDAVMAVDHDWIHYEEIFQCFTKAKCRLLEGKPKLFLFQACRVSSEFQSDTAENHQTDAIPMEKHSFPAEPHYLVAYATTPSAPAYRHVVKGSPFIRYFVQAARQANGRFDIVTVLTKVTQLMEENPPSGNAQIPCFNSNLTKKWFFPSCNASSPAATLICQQPP